MALARHCPDLRAPGSQGTSPMQAACSLGMIEGAAACSGAVFAEAARREALCIRIATPDAPAHPSKRASL